MSQIPITLPPAEEPPPGGITLPTEELTLDLPLLAGPGESSLASLPGEAASEQADTLVGAELQHGKYRVLAVRSSRVGSGLIPGETARLGAAYVALHTDLQKRLTLHVLPLDAQASAEEREQTTNQFIREVRVLARLGHPSLPLVHDYFCQGDACYVVMAELAERTLADVLAEAAQAGRVPALPPLEIARLGLELARALGYLHQQRPPLVLGGLRAEDIALPEDGPAQLVSLSALSIVASSASLPVVAPLPEAATPAPEAPTEPDAAAESSAPTLPMSVEASVEAGGVAPVSQPAGAGGPPTPPDRRDDLWSLGLLLRELAGGVGVVAQVMARRQPTEQTALTEAPLISLALAAVIDLAAHADPARRFQNAAALEHALERAYTVEQQIARQAGRPEETQAYVPTLDRLPPEQEQEALATQIFSTTRGQRATRPATICWKCGARNRPSAHVCRVCGARQPTVPLADEQTRPRRRTTRHLTDEMGGPEWWQEETLSAPRVPRSRPTSVQTRRLSAPLPRRQVVGRRVLWALVGFCFLMALFLGGTSVLVAYRALH